MELISYFINVEKLIVVKINLLTDHLIIKYEFKVFKR